MTIQEIKNKIQSLNQDSPKIQQAKAYLRLIENNTINPDTIKGIPLIEQLKLTQRSLESEDNNQVFFEKMIQLRDEWIKLKNWHKAGQITDRIAKRKGKLNIDNRLDFKEASGYFQKAKTQSENNIQKYQNKIIHLLCQFIAENNISISERILDV